MDDLAKVLTESDTDLLRAVTYPWLLFLKETGSELCAQSYRRYL
ncbi:hypothetical protein U2F10_18365 [Leptothoe sp. EHU-05/26/07-4]